MLRPDAGIACLAFQAFAEDEHAYALRTDGHFTFVQHVLSMDTTFADNAAMWRAISAPCLWYVAYWLIIAGEALTATCWAQVC